MASETITTCSGVVSALMGNEMTVLYKSPESGQNQEITVIITEDSFEGSGELPSGASIVVKGTRTAGPQGKGAAGDTEGSAAAEVFQ